MRDEHSIGARTRRDFVTARPKRSDEHIASVLVQAWPDSVTQVSAALERLPGVEVHGAGDAGKLIVTVETASDAELTDRIHRIGATERVVAASLVYHHAEESFDGR